MEFGVDGDGPIGFWQTAIRSLDSQSEDRLRYWVVVRSLRQTALLG